MILDGQDNEMAWPEGPTHGHAEFTVWYEKVTRRFFDEVHTLKKVESTIDGATATVEVVVNWRASVWEPPSPNSKRRMSPLAVADLDVTANGAGHPDHYHRHGPPTVPTLGWIAGSTPWGIGGTSRPNPGCSRPPWAPCARTEPPGPANNRPTKPRQPRPRNVFGRHPLVMRSNGNSTRRRRGADALLGASIQTRCDPGCLRASPHANVFRATGWTRTFRVVSLPDIALHASRALDLHKRDCRKRNLRSTMSNTRTTEARQGADRTAW